MEVLNATNSWLSLDEGSGITMDDPSTLEARSWLPSADGAGDYMTDELSTTEPPYHVPRRAYFVISGLVIHIGLVFNTLALVVLATSVKLRKTSGGIYLMGLSLADTVYLFGEFLRWINRGHKPFGIEIYFMDHSRWACKMIYFLRYGGKITSSWLTVAITAERLLLVAFPLKHPGWSTPRRTKIMIAAIFVAGFLFGSFVWWSVDVTIDNMEIICGMGNKLWYEIGNWTSLRIGSLLLPGLIVCVLTGIIIYYITRAQKTRERKLSSRRLQRQETIDSTGGGKISVERQLTIMLIAVAVAFIVLRLPYTITFYLNRFKTTLWPDESDWFYYHIFAANEIADTIATTNYAINFFLYYFCGNVFRAQLKRVCRCAPGSEYRYGTTQSSSMRLTTLPPYSRTMSVGRPESPRHSPRTNKDNVFTYVRTISGQRP